MRIKIISSVLILSFIILASPAFAVGKPDTFPGKPSNVGSATAAGQPSGVTGLPTQAQNRLTEADLKACQARENAIRK